MDMVLVTHIFTCICLLVSERVQSQNNPTDPLTQWYELIAPILQAYIPEIFISILVLFNLRK